MLWIGWDWIKDISKMYSSVEIDSRLYHYNTDYFIDLSIPLDFKGDQANYFDVGRATAAPYKSESVIGDTKQGGGCNFDVVTFIPHCNGTHTECVGHIVDEDVHVSKLITDSMIPATLVTVNPENRMISSEQLKLEQGFEQALIIRTLPNDESKRSATYDAKNLPPYFSSGAMDKLNELGIRHLLVDMPSIDTAYDEGKLENHHIFWGVDQGSHSLNGANPSKKTISEMIYVPNHVQDGPYLVQIQIIQFISDASPSRPLIFPLDLS